MEPSDKRSADLVSKLKSRDFWVPDEMCKVCYECDSQFTVFNRRHHCRLCGRVFCAKCTSNSIPISSDYAKNLWGAGDKVRVCNYCFRQWKLDFAASESVNLSGLDLSPSPSNTGNSSAKNAGSMHRRDGDDCECGRSNNVYPGFNISFDDEKMRSLDIEPVDLENYQQLWFPPEPQDEREDNLFDDGDDEDATGKNRTRDLPGEEHKKAMKNVVNGHLRSLIAQHIQEENLTTGEENNKDSWLEIITSLSWEAATLLKPDTGEGGGMYPGEYVKVKCIASGRRCESMVAKGVVCKKNVSHHHMSMKIEKPRIVILGGAFEYQHELSSFYTFSQEEDRLKMAVEKIDADHPNVLLVEKSVPRSAEEYLLVKNIPFVMNIRRPILEHIAVSTGAQIVPSIDHLSSQSLGYCDLFHVEKYLEEHERAGQDGKKLMKTLMFFEGCPKPLGCTILLKGGSLNELKKVKDVVQYGVFAAYRLALEASFLEDQEASLPERPLKLPVDQGKQASHEQQSMATSAASTFYSSSCAKEDKRNIHILEDLESESVRYNDQTVEETSECIKQGDRCEADDIQAYKKQFGSSGVEISHQETCQRDDQELSKEEIYNSGGESIIVLKSLRCIRKGTVCEHPHHFRINYYGTFDKPLGRFLRDNLFDESYRCNSCEYPQEDHAHYYIHCQGSLMIYIRKLNVLPGGQDGKIWMWHRCLRCPMINSFPPTSRRVVMSDAVWGLSFGKFLELSFSNSAAASLVASCGHSLHRDCLRFFCIGKFVACFQYAPVNVHSVYLPPSKLHFSYRHQEWIKKEADEVAKEAELLFAEVLKKLHQIAESKLNTGSYNGNMKISEFERKLQSERIEFENSLQKVTKKEAREGQPIIDILEINKLRRQLLFQSYFWDQCLIYTAQQSGNGAEGFSSWIELPFSNFYCSINKDENCPKVDALNEYSPVYISLFQELECRGGARLFFPVGTNDTVIPVYDDEPTSIICYALVSYDYSSQVSDEQEKVRDIHYSSLSFTKDLHARVYFSGDGPLGKVKYAVTCYYAKHFHALRRDCCTSELGFIRSLSRCKKSGSHRGKKSDLFLAKSLDDRFIIKQVKKAELESFIRFAPEYLRYFSESIRTGAPTCLAKILGIYQITKRMKGGKESSIDVLVMENLFYERKVTRIYDLNGSTRSRYKLNSSGKNDLLHDQNLIEEKATSPIFVKNKARRLLDRAIWNDTSFLTSIDVISYSLLVGVDEEKHELVVGIIDFLRQYTWDKQLETWFKASAIFGGDESLTPKQYKKRFRKAMSSYFLGIPD